MYTVYKIINKINNKYYIGVHKTDQPYDEYMGSGLAILNAIKKYGKENFNKEILHITEFKDEAYALEKYLTENYLNSDNYNMKLGGIGGFSKEDSYKGFLLKCSMGGKKSKELGYAFGGCHSSAKENGRKGGLAGKGKPKIKRKHRQEV